MRKTRKGWFHPLVYPTSLFIRDYLMEKGEAYPFEIYMALKRKREELGIKVGTYTSFYRYIWLLEKFGLIRRTGRVEPASRGAGKTLRRLHRVYYELVPELVNDERWYAPQRYYKPYARWHKLKT